MSSQAQLREEEWARYQRFLRVRFNRQPCCGHPVGWHLGSIGCTAVIGWERTELFGAGSPVLCSCAEPPQVPEAPGPPTNLPPQPQGSCGESSPEQRQKVSIPPNRPELP